MPFAAEAPVNKSVTIGGQNMFHNTNYYNAAPISPLAGAGANTLKHNSVHLPSPTQSGTFENSNFYNE